MKALLAVVTACLDRQRNERVEREFDRVVVRKSDRERHRERETE